jgi:hypothetical protein
MHGDEKSADMVESTHMYLFSGHLRQYWRFSSTNQMQAYQLFNLYFCRGGYLISRVAKNLLNPLGGPPKVLPRFIGGPATPWIEEREGKFQPYLIEIVTVSLIKYGYLGSSKGPTRKHVIIA